MAKTLYEGYRIGKNGGERWTGTIGRSSVASRFTSTEARKKPKGGSVVSSTTTKLKKTTEK